MSKWDKDFPAPAPEAAPAGDRPRVGFADPDRHRVPVVLLHPLEVNGERLDALVIRRLTAGEMVRIVDAIGADASDEALTRHVVAAMAGTTMEVLDALSSDDAGRVASAALPFMPAGLVAALERALNAAADAGG